MMTDSPTDDELARLKGAIWNAFLVSFHDEGGVYLGDISAKSILALISEVEEAREELSDARPEAVLRARVAHLEAALRGLIKCLENDFDGAKLAEATNRAFAALAQPDDIVKFIERGGKE